MYEEKEYNKMWILDSSILCVFTIRMELEPALNGWRDSFRKKRIYIYFTE